MDKASRRKKRLRWTRSRVAESAYAARLRALARQVGMIARGMSPDGSLGNAQALADALRAYAKVIRPWAESVAKLMVADVARRDAAMWKKQNADLGRALAAELSAAPTGSLLTVLQAQQVALIQSIPLKAAERVHAIAQESLVTSARAKELAQQILATEDVTVARATLIARTEVARASSNLVQARATFAGSEGYIWRTSGDADVRESHSDMEGRYVRWSTPPTLDKMTGHAGTLPNCRCFAEPVFPEDD